MVLLMPHLFDLVHCCLDLNMHSSVALLCPVIDLIGLYKEELGSVLIIKLSLIQISVFGGGFWRLQWGRKSSWS
ncbi:hypothetical protein CsSME_00038448 [Camellia sinensis var. sinensis]